MARFDIREHAQAAGRRSGEARRQKAAAKALLTDPLPALRDVASARAILAVIVQRGAAGALAGTVLMGVTRAVEAFLKSIEAEASARELAELRAEVAALKAELDQGREGWR